MGPDCLGSGVAERGLALAHVLPSFIHPLSIDQAVGIVCRFPAAWANADFPASIVRAMLTANTSTPPSSSIPETGRVFHAEDTIPS
jgi:hypothetical protein